MTSYQRVLANASAMGLKLKKNVPKDGNCFFHAALDQIHRFPQFEDDVTTDIELRKKVCGVLGKMVRLIKTASVDPSPIITL